MKRTLKTALGLILSATMITSCGEEAIWGGDAEQGGVALQVSADGRLMKSTRADDSMSPVVPDGSMFKIEFTKSDNTYSKQWSSVEGFNREKSFSMGDYKLVATYGDSNVEGFENPYYRGTADVHVSPGATTDVNVVATLANAMVSIRYTDEFRSCFKAYSAAVQTAGHDWVMFAQDENRPAYIVPGEGVKLNLTLTNDDNQTVTVQPAAFDAVARHHYVITIGVNGNVTYGTGTLDVQFDDEVISETVSVPLGDELFTAPAPSIEVKGVGDGGLVEKIAYEELTTNPEFQVFAFGGFKSATLNIIGYSPMFKNNVELINTDDFTNQQLENEGVGNYFRNADKMAVVNVKKFLEQLPAGEYTIQLQVVDAMTRTTEPVELKAVVTPLSVVLSPAGNAEFMTNSIAVDLKTNSANLKNGVTFKVPNAKNVMVEVAPTSVEDVTGTVAATRADGLYTYRYVLPIEPSFHSAIDVEMAVKSKKTVTANTTVTVNEPEYTITPDAFSKYVVLKVESDNSEIVKTMINNLKFKKGTSSIPTTDVSHDVNNGLIFIKGLTKSTAYNLNCECGDFKKSISFTTESETAVPNGDFSSLKQEVKFENVQVGGQYKAGAINYTIKSNISYQEPAGWSTVNENTCWNGTNPQNTWFMVPSTNTNNGAVVIRTVGYNHRGTVPSKTGEFFSTTYYCTNTPSDNELNKLSGELFLGSYSYNGQETRVDGIEFNSRPTSISFDYSYVPVNNETGEMSLKLIDADGNILCEKTLTLTSTSFSINKSLNIDTYPFGKKVAKILLNFKSTKSGITPHVVIPSGSNLNEGISRLPVTPYISYVDTNEYHHVATGSVLTIDNVKLGYEAPFGAAAASKRRR